MSLRRRRRSGRRRTSASSKSSSTDSSNNGDASATATTTAAAAAGTSWTRAALHQIGWLIMFLPLTIMSLAQRSMRLAISWLVFWPVSMLCFFPGLVLSRLIQGSAKKVKSE